jgi:hypothetical protein
VLVMSGITCSQQCHLLSALQTPALVGSMPFEGGGVTLSCRSLGQAVYMQWQGLIALSP